MTDQDGWHRLHPLSPVIAAGRLLAGIGSAAAIALAEGGSLKARVPGLIAVVLLAAAGVVRWLVTRWRLEDGTLRIETGLLRRDSRQLPVARIQAVDVVRPLLARWLGLAELQVRLAGSSSASSRRPERTRGDSGCRRCQPSAGAGPALTGPRPWPRPARRAGP